MLGGCLRTALKCGVTTGQKELIQGKGTEGSEGSVLTYGQSQILFLSHRLKAKVMN